MPLATMWLTLAPVKVNSDQVCPTTAAMCTAEGELHGQERRERVRSVTKGAARRQVLPWFDSLWSVHLSQMSSFITAELHRVARIYEIYSKGLDKGISGMESAGDKSGNLMIFCCRQSNKVQCKGNVITSDRIWWMICTSTIIIWAVFF